ncbi:hypothetical protein I7I53_02106 [Histoplasma capsulatum var. duboisii H88]|uniref:Uncharacterized protein n=1 Tax=Ajellomyces capsulatus (strain H88) TaxID=544711 RepID=A0A8A1LQ23_AJEC8|nr:hypothetical protein I7I53_02106 [Histoplasma capsulatum var. duboisii H88]
MCAGSYYIRGRHALDYLLSLVRRLTDIFSSHRPLKSWKIRENTLLRIECMKISNCLYFLH